MNSPLVSVIIPCYNCGKFVEQAIRSIMTQTYRNLEILVTDDCSSDNTLEILTKLAAEDNRIKIIENKENLKIVKTLNNMIKIATGKYIARMDADDIALPNRIKKQVIFLELHPDYALCGTNAWHIDSACTIIGRSCLPLEHCEIEKFKIYACPFYHPSVMVVATVFKQYNYDAQYLYAEDYELWVRVLERYKGYNLKDRLLLYRIHQDQISVARYKEQVQNTKSIFYNYNFIPDTLASYFVDFMSGHYHLKKDEKHQVACFLTTLYTKNMVCDVVLYVKLLKLRLIPFSLIWILRESMYFCIYLLQTKIILKLWKIRRI